MEISPPKNHLPRTIAVAAPRRIAYPRFHRQNKHMKVLNLVIALVALATTATAAPLEDNIEVDALLVTKAELRRHMSASETDQFIPATYSDLAATRGEAQPDYIVLRFKTTVLGHYSGEVQALINDSKNGLKVNVTLHYNKGWVEYFIPMDGVIYGMQRTKGSPTVSVKWNRLRVK